MSKIARWSYKNVATIKPFLSIDEYNGAKVYGEPYTIACNWIVGEQRETGAGGQSGAHGDEFVVKHTIFTEDGRPKMMDMVQLDDMTDWEEIRDYVKWDMALFNDTPDYKFMTG